MNPRLSKYVIGAFCPLWLLSCTDAVQPGPIAHRDYQPGAYTKIPGVNAPYDYLEDYDEADLVPQELVVRLKSFADETALLTILEEEGLLEIQSAAEASSGDDGIRRLRFAEEANLDGVYDYLRDLDEIDFVEPNLKVSVIDTPSDPMWSTQWGPSKIKAKEAWDYLPHTPKDYLVGVIDTGIDYTHPDLADAMWQNEAEIPANNVDDDGNGYVDDVYGYDFVNFDADPYDDHYHGTHCAGIIGASHNTTGIAGVAPNVKLVGLKFLAANGRGSSYGAMRSLRYANDMNVPITNNSWGGGPYSAALYSEISRSLDIGSIFVAAAGNNNTNTDAVIYYPMGYDLKNVVSVGSSTTSDSRSWFSNYGQTTVDLFAPGSHILATFPDNSYSSISGTSMAAPHVAGAFAVLWAALPPQTAYLDVISGLLEHVDPVAAFETVSVTGGRLNLLNALETLADPAPATPGGLSVEAGVESDIFVSWDPSDDENLGGYRIYFGVDQSQYDFVDVSVDMFSHRLADLQNDETYFIALAAITTRGTPSDLTEALTAIPTDGIAPAGILNLTAYIEAGLQLPVTLVASSGDYGEDWDGDASIDGNINTAWSAPILSERAEHDLLFGFDGNVTLGQIRIYHGDGFVHYFPSSFDIETSDNGADWITVVSESGYTADPGTWGVWNFNGALASMVRFRVTEPQGHENGLFYAVLPEIGFYEAANSQNAAELTWSAPGDDGFTGTAASYEIRYSETPITATNFDTASLYSEVGAPQISGSLEQIRIDGLMPERQYFFAMVSEDEAGNRSPVSNLASVTTLGLPPGAIQDLRALQVGETSITLGWTAPGDDDYEGQAASYDLRHATVRLHSGTFLSGTPIQMTAPQSAGSAESIEVTGLLPQTTYFFALRSIDDSEQSSVLSNILQVTTGNLDDTEPPSAVADLWAYVEELQGTDIGVAEVQSNGDYPGDWDVTNLIDGLSNTAWASSAITNHVTTAEVVFELSGTEPWNVGGIRMTPYTGFLDLFPKTFRIEVSLDDENYIPVAGRTGQPRTENPLEIVFENEQARYVKLIINEVADDFNNQFAVLSEFEVFSPAGNGFEVVLQFTAPGDDAHIGQGTRYDIRASESEIRIENYSTATILTEASPHLAGTLETYRFDELLGERNYYFALKTLDDQGNWSDISNIATLETPPIPPAAVVDLSAQGGPGYIDLSWTATGDNGREGQAALYEIRWSHEAITPYNFNAAFIAPNTPVPAAAGSSETYRLTGLDNEEKIYFALKATDAKSNSSLISNVTYGVSWDTIAPSTVADVTLLLSNNQAGEALLQATFSPSGDDWLEGEVSGYELYVHTEFIQDSNIDEASMLLLAPNETQRFLEGLPLETEHHIVVRAYDNQPNFSGFSTNVSAFTAGIPPGAINDFSAFDIGVSQVSFSWTATGDDDLSGTVSICQISITHNGDSDTEFVIMDPLAGGLNEARTVTDLSGNTDYGAVLTCWDDRNQSVSTDLITFRTDDGEPPAAILDFSLQTGNAPGALELSWTAPGDDSNEGTAVAYEIRYNEGGTFAESDFNTQLLWANTITPQISGSLETLSLSLSDERQYCFAVIAIDDKGLKGAVSNIACADSGWEAPAIVTDLQVVSIDRVDIALSWTASGDNGTEGQGLTSHLRYATQPLSDDNWELAIPVENMTPPLSAGGFESFIVQNLNGATTYYFGLKIEDDKGLMSPLSNVVSAHTEDTVPPAPVLDLSAAASSLDGVMILSWTASGENGDQGSAQSVEVRYLAGSNDDFAWDIAAPLSSVPGAGTAGMTLTAFAQALTLETTYCFMVRTTDTVGNVSEDSNVACAETQESPPAQIIDLTATGLTSETVSLQWTAPGSSANEGQASSYEVRYHSAQLTNSNWPMGTLVNINTTPGPAGTLENAVVGGLVTDTSYYFAIKTTDERGNVSPVSTNVVGETLDEIAPATILDLSAGPGSLNGTIVLNWTAVGDSGLEGRATAYEIKYSRYPITSDNFDATDSYTYVLAPKIEGQTEQVTLSSLENETSYYFAVKALDEVGNASMLGNVASADTPEVLPGRVSSLSVTEVGIGQLGLSWTSSGDDGILGIASAYDLRYNTEELTADNWNAAISVSQNIIPQAYGLEETWLITGLADDTLYYIGLRVIDDRGNASVLSNIVSGQTFDVMSPAEVTTLVAQPPLGDGGVITVGSAEATSTYSSSWTAAALIDGDSSTSWASQISAEMQSQSFKISWGASKEVGAINLFATKDYEHLFPKAFTIELSDNGSDWITVANEVGFEAIAGYNRWSFDGVSATEMRVQISDFGTIAGQFIAMVAEVSLEETTPDPRKLSLRWLAVGDDLDDGTATSYEIRYSETLITDANFSQAVLWDDESTPRSAGSIETGVITDLNPETAYYVAMKVTDEAGNESGLSNIATATTRAAPPGQIQDLRVENVLQNQFDIVWTAPGDDGETGQAANYDLRRSSQSLTLINFEDALSEPTAAPEMAGSLERVTVSGLNAGTRYYLAIRTQDTDGNWSEISNVLNAETAAGPDTIAPETINSLSASLPSGDVNTSPIVSEVSGAQFPDGQAELLLDGQLGTDWYTPARENMQEEAVIIDLGVEVLIEEVVLTASSFFPELFPQTYDISLSLDGVNYQTVASGSVNNVLANAEITHTFAAMQGQFVKLTISETASGSNGLFYVALAELSVNQSAANDGKALLTWVATGDDAASGSASTYEVRYSQSPIDDGNLMSSSIWLENVPTPSPSGALETCTLSGLDSGALYYFTVIALDEDGNSSGLSNIATVTIP